MAIAGCATPANYAATDAAPPQIAVPERAREACGVTIAQGDGLDVLETGYRERGVDVLTCDGKRELAVFAADTQAKIVDAWLAARKARNSWICRTLGVGC